LPLSEEVGKAFGFNTTFTVLLRPDNHIGLIFPEVSIDKVDAYFKQNIGIKY